MQAGVKKIPWADDTDIGQAACSTLDSSDMGAPLSRPATLTHQMTNLEHQIMKDATGRLELTVIDVAVLHPA